MSLEKVDSTSGQSHRKHDYTHHSTVLNQTMLGGGNVNAICRLFALGRIKVINFRLDILEQKCNVC